MSLAAVGKWLGERVPIPPELLRRPLKEELPLHLRGWTWCLGGTPLLLFCILATTGILLTFYYVPYPMHAHESVQQITFSVRFGWFVRGLHRGASHVMVVAVLLHMLRVLVTRAYRRPREINWVIGAGLFLLTLGFAFTGYSLVYDQLSYWATTVGTNMIAELPMVGQPLLYLLRGGADINPNTLARFYDFHVGLLPALFLFLLLAHVLLLRLHGVAPHEGDARHETYPFFPDHVLRESTIGLLVLLGLVVFTCAVPPGVGPKADPDLTPEHIRPEWYFFPSYRWLKLVPIQVGLWTSLAFVLCLVFWPFLDAAFDRLAPGKRLGTLIGAGGFLFTVFLLVWEALA